MKKLEVLFAGFPSRHEKTTVCSPPLEDFSAPFEANLKQSNREAQEVFFKKLKAVFTDLPSRHEQEANSRKSDREAQEVFFKS